jgi:hypothetical protein
MARTQTRNPWLVGGPPLESRLVRATDAKTWKAGEFGVYAAAGTVEPIATDAVKVNVQFLQDQDASTSSTDVWVATVTADHVFEGFCGTDDADVAATVAAIGNDYGIHVANNLHTVNLGEASNVAVCVTDYAGNYSPFTDTSATSPGKVQFRFKASVLDAS